MAKAAAKSDPKPLQLIFKEEILPKLQKELGGKNIMALPRVEKIMINVGIGSYIRAHGKDFSNVIENITAITGQKPVVKHATKSVSNFKLREGQPVGLYVTLRGEKMYHFLSKLVNVIFPRVRDFRGISKKSFDGNGNYSIGFKEHVVFPEISPDDVMKLHGLQVVLQTSARNDEEGLALLTALGFPFKK